MRTRPVFVRIPTAGIRESHVHDVSIPRNPQLPRVLSPWRAFHDLPKFPTPPRCSAGGGSTPLTSTRTASCLLGLRCAIHAADRAPPLRELGVYLRIHPGT